jgi:hypothetical protein
VILEIEGCTAMEACNYDALATLDNGSCVFVGDACDDGLEETIEDVIGADCFCSGVIVDFPGCTDLTACNYDAGANADDGSCIFPGDNCDDGQDNTVNDIYTLDCVCAGEVVLSIDNGVNTNNLQMWPNPANQEVQVTLNGVAADMIDVFDIAGKRVDSFSRTSRLDVSTWAPGSYMIRITNGNNTMERRLMVVR